MNLGDGLKLETELLDGRTKLILSPYERKSEISVKMGNKNKIAKCPQRTKQTGRILKSTQNTCVRSEKCVQKKGIGSETSLAKSEKDKMTFLLTKDLCKRYGDNDYVHIQKGILPTTPNRKKTRSPVTCFVAQQKLCRNHVTPEDWKSSLVCLTQDQLQQILMTVNQGSRSVSVTESGKEETSQYNMHFNSSPNQPKDESIVGLLQKSEAVSSVLDENKSVLNKKQETSKHLEQKVTTENVWKPADIFSTLGERERDRSLLEAKKAQWRKELDEQVALKKKEKEASEKWNNNPWKKSESDKIVWEKPHALEQPQTSSSSSSILSPSPSQAVAVPADGDSVVRAAQNLEAEDYDRWAVHFDSFRSYPGSQPPQPSQSACSQPEYLCVSPDPQELADISSTCAPTDGSQLGPAEEKPTARPTADGAGTHGQKTNFLRSMTALLDPAQIEERDRRRQKQLEHQKAITAQVEEKRRRRQLEEEQRRGDEEEDERRLAREREALQRQLEEELRKQKQKEEIMTLKTEELLQAMQRAQELAQKRRQEQRIQDLAQKGHDTSRLLRNLGAGTMQMEHGASTGSSSERGLGPDAAREGTCAGYTTLPKKDTAVQTDDFGAGMLSAESRCRPALERQTVDSPSPETPADFSGQSYTEKNEQELTEDKGANLDKEDSWHSDHCSQVTGAEKPTKHRRKCLKRPDWNINKPLKRYIPASAKYPRQLQKQREENRVRRQMELLRLVERNHHGHLSCSRGASPEAAPASHGDTESRLWGHSVKKEELLTVPPFSRERSQSSPVPVTTTRTQQSPTNTLYLSLKNGNYERENLISEVNHTESSPATSELSHFIPYVRTDEIYYLDPNAPLSRPSTQDAQDPSSHDQDPVGDPLLNPHLIRNRDRQQAILKGLSDLRQGLLQKQKELETNLMPVATNQEENFSSLF